MATGTYVRPDALLIACVAYTHPEMDTFSRIIDSHSNRSLVLDDCASGATSLLSLPAEMLLHIRSFVQARLLEELTAEIHTALTDYESALVEGLCEDCFLWNCDIYGKDVWEWVANGYKNVCDCCVKGVDSRVFSSRKVMSMQQYAQLNIKTRREWLEAYISKTYLGGADVWETINESVIRHFDCSAVVRNPSGAAEGSSTRSEDADYMLRDLGHGSDFGTSVHIVGFDAAPDGVVKRLLRALGMDGQGGSQMSMLIPERSPSQRFTHLLSKRTKANMAQQGSPSAGKPLLHRLRSAFRVIQGEPTVTERTESMDARSTLLLSLFTSTVLALTLRLLS